MHFRGNVVKMFFMHTYYDKLIFYTIAAAVSCIWGGIGLSGVRLETAQHYFWGDVLTISEPYSHVKILNQKLCSYFKRSS